MKRCVPAFVRVLGRRIKVRWKPMGVLSGDYGTYSNPQNVITIASDISPERQRITFLHESLHALFSALVLDLSEDERMVSTLAHGLLSFIRENPEWVSWLSHSPVGGDERCRLPKTTRNFTSY